MMPELHRDERTPRRTHPTSPRRRPRRRKPGDEKWNEISTILKNFPEHDELTNPQISRLTGIDTGNIPRSRIKLWAKGLIATDDFKSTYMTNRGRKMKGLYIKDDVNFAAANKRWTAAKKRYERSIQPRLIDDDAE
jgi:hypothetical protein